VAMAVRGSGRVSGTAGESLPEGGGRARSGYAECPSPAEEGFEGADLMLDKRFMRGLAPLRVQKREGCPQPGRWQLTGPEAKCDLSR
jgi:hypothetical protein